MLKLGRRLDMIAEFIGTNGSMGFKTGNVYELWVFIRNSDKKIYVSRRKLCAKLIPYDTLTALYKNWNFIGE